MSVNTDSQKIKSVMASRYIDKIYPSPEAFEKRLKSGERLVVYHGTDPTAPSLHLGHSTNYFLLKKLQELGHRIILLIGDFTARIGDPTDKLASRQPLTKEEVLKNCKTYRDQVGRILDFESKENPAEVVFNSSWLSSFSFEDVLELASRVTVQQMIERDMFERRITEGREIRLHEFLYPLMQGYDSVALESDVEVGGSDQTFNMLLGRDLLKSYKHKEKFVITTPLLVNSVTGRKLMSKSEGGYIGILDKPDQMFGKVMALPDETIVPCFRFCTMLPDEEINRLEDRLRKGENPKLLKMILASEITALYHGAKKANKAREEFDTQFTKKAMPKNISETTIELGEYLPDELLVHVGLASSKSEARRLIKQRGVQVGDNILDSTKTPITITPGLIIRVGKLKFVKIV